MQNLFEFSPLVIAAIPVALGLVSIFKTAGFPSRFAPILSLFMGIGLVSLTGVEWQIFVAQGLIVGLAASGLYSGAKSTVQG